MLKGILTLLVIIQITISGCFLNDSTKEFRNKIVGDWELERESFPNGSYYSASKTITFDSKNNFSYEWAKDDIEGGIKGKYFILENPKHGYKTLSLIPDLNINGKDTIINYLNFDILNLNSERLHIIAETNYIERDTIPDIIFNKNYIYKRIPK